jgi:hypothetical protein
VTSLAELQAFFGGAIAQPVPIAEQPGARERAPKVATGNDRVTPEGQLEIYREQFWLRHVGALEEDFATLAHLLGHDGFHTLAERYVAAYPPKAFSLRDFGAHMAAFVASHEPYASDALLADCARLEWAFVEAFDAADCPPVEPAVIAAIPEEAWPGVVVTLHPAVQLARMAHPAHDYRAAIRAGESPDRPSPRASHVVVYRSAELLQYIDVPPLAFALLTRLSAGEPLGDACEAVAAEAHASAEELEAEIGAWFTQWAAAGWLVGLQPGEQPGEA